MLQDFEVEQLIFSSTDLVYAPSAPGQRINEDSPAPAQEALPESSEGLDRAGNPRRTGQDFPPSSCASPASMMTCVILSAGATDTAHLEHDITAYLFLARSPPVAGIRA